MRRFISHEKREQLEEAVVACRAPEREIASWERWMIRQLAPADGGEWTRIDNAILSVIANERQPLSTALRYLGIRTRHRRSAHKPRRATPKTPVNSPADLGTNEAV